MRKSTLAWLFKTHSKTKKLDVYIAPTTQKIESGNYVCLGRFGRTRFPNLATREKKFSGGREWEGGGEGKESRQFNSIVTKKFYCKAKCLFHFCKIWNKFNLFWTLMLQSCSCRFTRLSGLKMDMSWSMIKDMKELHFQKKTPPHFCLLQQWVDSRGQGCQVLESRHGPPSPKCRPPSVNRPKLKTADSFEKKWTNFLSNRFFLP